jgi:hypothetical protein
MNLKRGHYYFGATEQYAFISKRFFNPKDVAARMGRYVWLVGAATFLLRVSF